MRVLVLASTYPRRQGDSEPAFVHDLSRTLAKRGHTVHALVPHARGAALQEELEGVHVHRFRYFFPASLQKLCYGGGIRPNLSSSALARLQLPFLVLAECLHALNLSRRVHPNVVHAHWVLPQGLAAWLVKKVFGLPYVVTAHAGDVFPLTHPLLRPMAKAVVGGAFAVSANSPATAKALQKLAPGAEVKLEPMGTDVKAFSSAKAKKEDALLFVGRLVEKKGVSDLLEGFARLQKTHAHTVLWVAGEGPLRGKLEKQTAGLGLGKAVHFLGALPREEVAHYMARAQVFVLPARPDAAGDTEGQGVVVQEAWASGTPVVATKTGGIPYFVRDKENGLLVPPKDAKALSHAITCILDDASLATSLQKQGHSDVQRFDWRAVAARFETILKNGARK